MNTPIINCVQGSPEWFAARVGKVTASRLSDVMAKNRAGTGWGVTRTNYIAELVADLAGKGGLAHSAIEVAPYIARDLAEAAHSQHVPAHG